LGGYVGPAGPGGNPDYGHFYAPQPTPFAPLVAGAFNNSQAVPPGQTPRMPRPKHLERTPTPGANLLPRKSAMKKSASTSGTTQPRLRTGSGAAPPAQVVRQRTNSNPTPSMTTDFFPHHIFISFVGTSELVVENIGHPEALNELREELFPLWPVTSNESKGTTWRVHFTGGPWATDGPEGLLAWEIITRLFRLLARRGYSYLTSINTGKPPPRLVFIISQPDLTADFFLAHFSRSGHRVTLIDPPVVISEAIGANLRNALPRNIASDRVSEDNVLVIELKRNGLGAPEVDKSLFITHVLKQINTMGYTLQATIPLARTGVLGLGRRKEIWVFKGAKTTF